MLTLAEPLTDEAAAWIRDHVWTKAMRKEHSSLPSYRLTCACQFGLSTWCETGHCDNCPRSGRGVPSWETLICRRGGMTPVNFPAPYQHPHISAVGPQPWHLAMVWIADRTCRWQCPCTCHPAHMPLALLRPVQLDLFEVTT